MIGSPVGLQAGKRCDYKTSQRQHNENTGNSTMNKIIKLAAVAALVTSLTACAGVSRQQAHAAIGAGAGGALGYVLTGGPLGTIAGAAAGGLIGAGTR
jgi:osmotically inducible lipoprotein OsmB